MTVQLFDRTSPPVPLAHTALYPFLPLQRFMLTIFLAIHIHKQTASTFRKSTTSPGDDTTPATEVTPPAHI